MMIFCTNISASMSLMMAGITGLYQLLQQAPRALLERIRQAIEQGLDVNEADADGRTALMMAACRSLCQLESAQGSWLSGSCSLRGC